MRTRGSVGIAMLVVFGVVPTASADIYRTQVHGTAAVATFSDVSEDGCVVTTGLIAALDSSNGTYALATAERWDYCAVDGPAGSFYAGAGEVSYAASGLASAAATGMVVADEYTGRGLAPLTLEFDLAFAGTGAVVANVSRFASGGGGTTVSFLSSRSRAASVSGSLFIDGDPAAAAAGQLYAETAGDLVVVH